MLKIGRIIFTVVAVFAVALSTTLPVMYAQNGQNKVKTVVKKRIVVVQREQGQFNVKPTAKEIEDFDKSRTPEAVKARRIASFKSGRDLLVKKGFPFEPNLLLENNWRERLGSATAINSELRTVKRQGNKLHGAQLADTLILPEKVEVTGDTVIVANRIIFEGKNVVIKGNHDIHFFTLDPTTVVEAVSLTPARFTQINYNSSVDLRRYLETVRVVENGHITIDTSGVGRKEWLERQKQKQLTSFAPVNFLKSNFALNAATILQDDTSGQNGADGARGVDGLTGTNGKDGVDGANGSCSGNKNGSVGGDGGFGGNGEDADEGKNGDNGTSATNQNPYINIGDTNDYTFIANGGDGGRGGDGGTGGTGGRGGDGGKGGKGADCPCVTGGGGTGGNGGNAGNAGDGGNGGNGGDGGDAGDAGTITIRYPDNYDAISKTHITANAGKGGTGGTKGSGGYYGSTGTGGKGGKAGGAIECSGSNGTDGGPGIVGNYGKRGDNNGKNGSNGGAGNVNYQPYSIGGGGYGGGGYGGGGGGGGGFCYGVYEEHRYRTCAGGQCGDWMYEYDLVGYSCNY